MTFFNNLSFTSANEDGASELTAFAKRQPSRLLCLTGSGARVLDMCLAQPKDLIALDLNPAQNEVLRLKIAAFRALNDHDLYAYLGITPHPNRDALHARVEKALPEQSKLFWATRKQLIRKGIWYCGLWEKTLRFGAMGNRLIRGKNIDRLFAASTLEEQAQIWRNDFDDRLWRGSIRLLGQRWFWTHIIGEPGGNFLPAPAVIESKLATAFNHAAETFFFRESDFASLILRGRHQAPMALPLHLQSAFTDQVRNQLDCIQIVTGSLGNLQALAIENIDAFSVSDFGSYCTQSSYDKVWQSLIAAARQDAVFCEREFLNILNPTASVAWDNELSSELSHSDKSFIYKIRVGTLAHGAA